MALTETENRLVIVDAGPIIHLDQVEALPALGGFEEIENQCFQFLR